ncbi:MAG: YceI family protein [Leptospiraceae bacterium]
MHKSLILILTGTLIFSCAEAPDAEMATTGEATTESEATGEKRSINIEQSKVSWIGTKITGQHNGTIRIKSGHIFVDGEEITGGEFVMDMSTITVLDLTGEKKQKLEKHLRTTDFFEVQKYPESKFSITSVEKQGDSLQVTGNLTMRDTTHSIQFKASVEKDESGNPNRVTADFNIDRQKWGVVYKGKPDDAIRDEVNLKPEILLQ